MPVRAGTSVICSSGRFCVYKDILGGLIPYTNILLRENPSGWNVSASLNFTVLQPKFPGLVHLPSFLAK